MVIGFLPLLAEISNQIVLILLLGHSAALQPAIATQFEWAPAGMKHLPSTTSSVHTSMQSNIEAIAWQCA